MQIAPIRSYNMSQKQTQQNTNFKGVAFKLDKSSPALLKYIDNCKQPLAKIEGYKKDMLGQVNKLQTYCNEYLIPLALRNLLIPYRQECIIKVNDYEKLAKDIWPNDTEVNLKVGNFAPKDYEPGRPCYIENVNEVMANVNNKDYHAFDIRENVLLREDEQDSIDGFLFRLKTLTSEALDESDSDSSIRRDLYKFAENILKDQPGYKELIKTLEEKKAYKYSPEATEARRKTWLDDKELSVDEKINRLLEALSPEEIEALKKQLL